MEQPLTGPLNVQKRLSDKQFQTFADFIYRQCGIKLDNNKKILLEGRLMKRMKALQISSFQDYFDFFFSPDGQISELSSLIDVVTTNKTDFFREPDHFQFLINQAIPALYNRRAPADRRRFFVWSAGCSSGEEPYTLSMVLETLREKKSGFDFMILATDISNIVLDKARKGIYEDVKVAPVPMEMKKKYLRRSKDRAQKIVRVCPELRAKIKFCWLNLMEEFNIREKMEVIFCRNVIIYFDRPTQKALMEKFAAQLIPGGYLFLGHSETLTGFDLPLQTVAPTVYQKLP